MDHTNLHTNANKVKIEPKRDSPWLIRRGDKVRRRLHTLGEFAEGTKLEEGYIPSANSPREQREHQRTRVEAT